MTACATVLSPNSCLWIGDPESNRWRLFQAARERCGLPPAQPLSYLDALHRLPAGPWGQVRLESPGKCPRIEQALRRSGGVLDEGPPEVARVHPPGPWFEGFTRFCLDLPSHWNYPNHPQEVLLLFDKRRCHQHLSLLGLPVIAALPTCHSYDEVVDRARRRGWSQVFVKLFCGSSCSGTLAYGLRSDSAYTTIERSERGRYYNSRRVRRYSGPHARELIDWLCLQGAHIEEWMPKARWGGVPFDIRLVIIAGEACQRVLRCGSTPMLGLHLGARRGDADAIGGLSERLAELAPRLAQAFPRCLYLGADLLMSPQGELRIIEVNAFGDLLSGLLWQGQDTYELELRSMLNSA